jgi:hypothetical protein
MLFGTHIMRAICCTEEKDSSDKASRIALFISSRPSSLDDDEASSEFRPEIAFLQNIITLEYEMAFSWSIVRSSWWMLFSRSL